MTNQFYAVSKNQDNEFQLVGGPYGSKEAALLGGEMNILDTWGTKDKQYSRLINGLITMDESEAKYFGLV
jgi:hypothetical protein